MPDGKPDILVIWGDDIGISNLSCYSLMGYRTPNVDRGTAIATAFPATFQEIPPRHEPASFSSDDAVQKLNKFLAKD